MSDNSDLLGADTSAEVDKPKRGRPRKQNAPIAPQVAPAAEQVPDDTAPPATVPPELADLTLGALVPTGTENALLGAANAEAECSRDLSDLDPLAGLVSTPETDGSVSVTLPPVSPEYALAMANRVKIIGESKREYAWQRLRRAGKKL